MTAPPPARPASTSPTTGPGMPVKPPYWNGFQYPPPPRMSPYGHYPPTPGMGPYTYAYQYQPPAGQGMPPYWNGAQYPPPAGPGMQPYQHPPATGYQYNYPIPPPYKVSSASFIKGAVLGKLFFGTDAADALIGDLPFLS